MKELSRAQRLYQTYYVEVDERTDRVAFSGDNVERLDVSDSLCYSFREPEQLLEAATKYLKNNPDKVLESIALNTDLEYRLTLYFE